MGSLRWHARNARIAARARERIARTGLAPGGRHPIWNKKEDQILRAHFPDLKAAKRRLKRRTLGAIGARARFLNMHVGRYHQWTAAEVSRLRRIYPVSSKEQVLQAFPGLRWQQILGKLTHCHIRKKRRPPTVTGVPVIDAIRRRAFDLRISMRELDRIVCSPGYFVRHSSFRTSKSRMHRWSDAYIYRAIEALGGDVLASWR